MQKILILERDQSRLHLIISCLHKQSCICEVMRLQSRFQEALERKQYDFFICCLNQGIDSEVVFLRKIQEKRKFAKILFFSKHSSYRFRLILLHLVDELIVLPYDEVELQLRIKNLLNLHKIPDKNTADNTLYALRDTSDSGYGEKMLRAKEVQILECLMRHKNMVTSYDTIYEYVWGNAGFIPIKKTVNVYIRRIRSKLLNHGFKIITLKNRGYKLVDLQQKFA